MNDHESVDLTAGGQARRDAMLDELCDSMDGLHRRRRFRRRVGVAGGSAVALIALVVMGWPAMFSPDTSVMVEDEATDLVAPSPWTPSNPPVSPVPNRTAIRVISTRSGIVARYAHQPRRSIQRVSSRPMMVVQTINDRILLQLLAQLDRPTGLIRAEGKTWLTAAVTDAALETLRQSDPMPHPQL